MTEILLLNPLPPQPDISFRSLRGCAFLGLLLGPEAACGGPKNPSQDPSKRENTAFFNTAVALGPWRESGYAQREGLETGPQRNPPGPVIYPVAPSLLPFIQTARETAEEMLGAPLAEGE